MPGPGFAAMRLMCSIFFGGGIIKRGNGVGRTEWGGEEKKKAEVMEGGKRAWTEQTDAAVNYVELFLVLCACRTIPH